MKTIIMAGGKGTRISSVANDIPKPMIKIDGKPVLEHEIELLKKQGFNDIIITVGHLKDVIIDYFGNGNKISECTGEKFGVHIEYFIEAEPLGNAGALFRLRNKLLEDFLLLNADVMFNVDFNKFVSFHKRHHGMVTLFTHPNSHPYDSGLIFTDDKGRVKKWLSKEDVRPLYYQNRVNAGLHVISPEVLKQKFSTGKIDLDQDILKPLAGTGKMYAYDSFEYVKDMGTPERYYEVCQDFLTGKIQKKSFSYKQRAIFLDRDGTINKYKGFLSDINEFELLDNVAEAIKRFNKLGYLVIVVTNQPVVARGELSFEKLRQIHNKMETLLGQEGAYIDHIYFCPHHPKSGFLGEIPSLKIECTCRKPKPGMLFQAAKAFNIDLNDSWMVGDSAIDIEAGQKAGCKTALISAENVDYGQDLSVNSIMDFYNKLNLIGVFNGND